MPGPVFLPGTTIDLHTIEEEDLAFLQRVINDPDVWISLGRVSPATAKEERDFYENVVHAGTEEHLLVCVDSSPVGIIGLHDINPHWGTAEIGYFLDQAAHGNGYATDAVQVLTDYAFNQRRLAKLIASVFAENTASQRVLEKNGFEEEGRLEQYLYRNGKREDMCIYGKLADRVSESD